MESTANPFSSGNALTVMDRLFSDYEEQGAAVQATSAAVSEFLQSAAKTGNRHAGRVPGSKNVHRGTCSWYEDYLAPNPVYPPNHFREVFRVPLDLYRILHSELLEEEPMWQQQTDGWGRPGHTSYQKILSTLRKLGSGMPFKQLDDMVRMSPESQRASFRLTLEAIYRRFGPVYLNREPTESELRNIVRSYEKRGFPGCIGAVDCMHMYWKNCPKAYKGQYHNPKHGKLATIQCEALCDNNLYCWHWFSGRCGSNNDITMVDNSPLFIDIMTGKRRMTLSEGYMVNGVVRNWLLYMLGDGFYPTWAILVRPISAPVNDREKNMTARQESVRKDIERFFGVLQGRFKILRHEMFEWSDTMLVLISQVCVILHNMIVDMAQRGELRGETDQEGSPVDVVAEFLETEQEEAETAVNEDSPSLSAIEQTGLPFLLERSQMVRSTSMHRELMTELRHHMWALQGNE